MFCEKAFELIKELHRSPDSLPLFNEDVVRQILEEMRALFEQNQRDVFSRTKVLELLGTHLSTTHDISNVKQLKLTEQTAHISGDAGYLSGVHLRHTALERNKRCLLAYLYNRLVRIRQMRWEFGSILPPDIKYNLCEPEIMWFHKYSKSLANYMKSIGDNHGLNLTQDTKPPKSLYVEVRCQVDYGKFELEDGETVLLKKNSHHLLPRAQCEPLIRQGILHHIEQ